MPFLSVAEAQQKLLSHCSSLGTELVPLDQVHQRVLGADLVASHSHPSFAASSMDGFAVRAVDLTPPTGGPLVFSLIGEAQAGHPFAKPVGEREAVRIFTGAPLPAGADKVIIQELCTMNNDEVRFDAATALEEPSYVRPLGYDFQQGDLVLTKGLCMKFRHLPLLASLNLKEVLVMCRPKVAVLATGDELVPPGAPLAPGQIVSSVPLGLKALLEKSGAEVELLGIARDELDDLRGHIQRAKQADVLLTIGGASVGAHDLVQEALIAEGLNLDFWRIAMRPGKPLMVGQLGAQKVIGVPGNPVSAMVCTLIFVVPLIKSLLGEGSVLPIMEPVRLRQDLPQNGSRAHYMRAVLEVEGDGVGVRALDDQDSSLQRVFSEATALIVRPVDAPAVYAGDLVDVIRL